MNSADYPFSNCSPCFAVLEIKKKQKAENLHFKRVVWITPSGKSIFSVLASQVRPLADRNQHLVILAEDVSLSGIITSLFFSSFFQAYILISNLKKIKECSEIDGRSREVIPMRKQMLR